MNILSIDTQALAHLSNDSSPALPPIDSSMFYKVRLIGQIIDVYEHTGQSSLSLDTITHVVQPLIHLLRKNDGSKHKGTLVKMVKGALSADIFQKQSAGVYTIDLLKASQYKQHQNALAGRKQGKSRPDDLTKIDENTSNSYESQFFKQIRKIVHLQNKTLLLQPAPLIKKIRKQRRRRSIVHYQQTCLKLEQMMHHLESQHCSGLFKSPFQVLRRDGISLEQMITKMGAQEVLSYTRCYNYFAPLSTTTPIIQLTQAQPHSVISCPPIFIRTD